MADLSWLPYDTDVWERRVREMGLTLAEEGALMRLLRGAWRATEPCTILDTPDELARIVGAEWKKAVGVLRAQFDPLPDHPTRRRCGWLYDLYLRQFEKHLSYQNRGGEGARRKAELKAQREAQLEAQLEVEPKPSSRLSRAESRAEALSCAPAEHTAKSPLPDDALSPVGDALAGATNGNGTGDYLDRPSVREALLRRGVRPEQLDAASLGAPPEDRDDLNRRHYLAFRDAADRWISANADDAKQLGRNLRQMLGLPLRGELPPAKERVLRESVYAEIARLQGWPTADAWDGEPLSIVEAAHA